MESLLDSLADLLEDTDGVDVDLIRGVLDGQPALSQYELHLRAEPPGPEPHRELIVIEEYQDSRHSDPQEIEILVRSESEEGEKNLRTLYIERLPNAW